MTDKILKRHNIRLLELLKHIDITLDNINGKDGTKDRLCVFCRSKKYNGKSGIVHKKMCVLKRVRLEYNYLENLFRMECRGKEADRK